MSWTAPIITWQDNNLVTATDFNRIESNIAYLRALLG